MLKRFLLLGTALLLVLGGAIGFKLFKRSAIQDYVDSMGLPVVHINATVAREVNWQQQLQAIGSLRARSGIELSSEVDGVIQQVHAEPGQRVNEGELLVEIDDAVDQATLKSARVRLEKASRDFQRDRALLEKALISKDKFENSRTEYEAAQALVEETQGIIDRKAIRAPFTGTVGIHNLAVGHYLAKGDNLFTFQALEQLYLDLNLPEKELEFLSPGQAVNFVVPSHGNQVFNAEVRFIDVQVKSTTRTVLVRSLVDNKDLKLLPGMFASANIILNASHSVVAVPREAVSFSLIGETVHLLEPLEGHAEASRAARRQSVKTGELRGGLIAISGIQAGQLLALDTQHRLLEGTPVVIVNQESLDDANSTAAPESD